MSRRLRVVVIDEEVPFPLTSGKRLRTWHLLTRLADRHDILLLAHRNGEEAEVDPACEAFRQRGVEVRALPHRVPPRHGPVFYARLLANLASPLPYSVTSHTSTGLVDAVRALAAERRVDLWHCEWTPYAHVLRRALGPALERAAWLVMAHNVESRIWERYFRSETQPLARTFLWNQWVKYRRFEQSVYAAAPMSVAVSAEDARLMREEFSARSVTVVDNGVDTGWFLPNPPDLRDPSRLLFMGSLDWRPNQDAVRLLLDRILPAVRAVVPEATLEVVGRRPPAWLSQQAAATPGVTLHADVPDVRPHLARCGMLVVPLRIGGGSRLKILEALAMETPVVSTRTGAEGLELTPGRDLMVVEHPDEMAAAIVEAVRNPPRLRAMAAAARADVLSRYDWEPLSQKLEEAWRATCGPAEGA